MWDALTTVSNPGRKRGRARHVKGLRMDLNKGQRLGDGKVRMSWPGLNTATSTGESRQIIQELEADPERKAKLAGARMRRKMTSRRVPALQRGWSGNSLPGTSIGPPDPINDYKFEGFDSRVLELKRVSNVTANLGKIYTTSAFVATGNGNGLAGYGIAKAANMKAALRIAKNRAAQQLVFIERYNEATVYHNFHCQVNKSQIFVHKAAEGSGVKAHRCIKTLCQLIGITDLRTRTEGSTRNIQNITKAFFNGLIKQETHQQLAERMGLNVVEIRRGVPTIVARPQNRPSVKKEDKPKSTDLIFANLYFDGKVPLKKRIVEPFYHKMRPYKLKQFFLYKNRNQRQIQRERAVYGLEPNKEERKIRCLPLK
ncbi:hypothetical protein LOTGIDRAFT_230880 [Lottia gigantea]|uniref:Small ribosomal subunit protein uS5m n=1 Tax=Lottia gigantea TaxID=225164 RepID=V4CDH1_LOTGI|nr:hypothetical protein LOTGIDRAFT_230880 [Lottia gigantea]ESO99954.1 hypothetical protein LOTGIDRAFT_230880 [Lottia gigantea]